MLFTKKITKILWRMRQIFIEFHLVFESGISYKKIDQVLHWFRTEISSIQRLGVVIGLLKIMLYSWSWRIDLNKARLVTCGYLLSRKGYLELIDQFGVRDKSKRSSIYLITAGSIKAFQKYLSMLNSSSTIKYRGMLIIGKKSAEFCNILVKSLSMALTFVLREFKVSRNRW